MDRNTTGRGRGRGGGRGQRPEGSSPAVDRPTGDEAGTSRSGATAAAEETQADRLIRLINKEAKEAANAVLKKQGKAIMDATLKQVQEQNEHMLQRVQEMNQNMMAEFQKAMAGSPPEEGRGLEQGLGGSRPVDPPVEDDDDSPESLQELQREVAILRKAFKDQAQNWGGSPEDPAGPGKRPVGQSGECLGCSERDSEIPMLLCVSRLAATVDENRRSARPKQRPLLRSRRGAPGIPYT